MFKNHVTQIISFWKYWMEFFEFILKSIAFGLKLFAILAIQAQETRDVHLLNWGRYVMHRDA